MNSQKTVHAYVTLLEEGTDTIRPTQAVDLGNGTYRLLPTPNYDPEDETWEFPPRHGRQDQAMGRCVWKPLDARL